MWDTPFDESMLSLPQGVVIYCPDENLAEDLFELFEQSGVGENWSHDLWFPHWGKYKEETAYFVHGKRLLYGPKKHADGFYYSSYAKCTFYGKDEPFFEPANDSEMQGFLGF